MNILHVITSVNPAYGGPIEGLKQLATVLTQEGNNVDVASLDSPLDSWVGSFPFPVYPQGPGTLKYAYSPRLIPWLRANHKRYDGIIVNGLWQFGSFAVHRVLRGSSVPYFVFSHGMLDPWFQRTYPLKHLKKLLYWRWGEYPVLRDARAVLFTCEEERVLARQSFRPFRCREVVVNYGTSGPSGDLAACTEAFLDEYPQLRGKRLLLFLSRIHEKKGCDLLLEAFAHARGSVQDLHLVMAGPDQSGWQAQLEVQAERLGLTPSITWTGMLTGDVKWGAYSASEAFVLPSHQENFGIVVAEALACSRPVLITDKVNIWREIETEGAGLVARDDMSGVQSLLNRWLALSPEARKEMEWKARACFERNFEIHQATRSLIDVLRGGVPDEAATCLPS